MSRYLGWTCVTAHAVGGLLHVVTVDYGVSFYSQLPFSFN